MQKAKKLGTVGFDRMLQLKQSIYLQNVGVFSWDCFREKGPNVYIIKFPVCTIEM